MIVLVSGAKKNIGDFIITNSALVLLRHIKKEKIIQLPNWESLDKNIGMIKNTRALIVAGGPGYRPNMYKGVYPLFSDVALPKKLNIPIYFLGLGWKGDPGDMVDLENYYFNNETRKFISLNKGLLHFSARDVLSFRVLKQNKIGDATMTGCPVWYDPKKIGSELIKPKKVQSIIFTPPQKFMFYKQSQKALLEIRKIFPRAKIYCSFHRGIKADNFTTDIEAERLKEYAKFAKENGFIVKDVSYDLKKINFYNKADLHVGYRLHAHLYFLRNRKPSLLIEEDGRGIGMSKTLSLPGITAWRYKYLVYIFNMLFPNKISTLIRRYIYPVKSKLNINNEIRSYIIRMIESNYVIYKVPLEIIDRNYNVMKKFIEEI